MRKSSFFSQRGTMSSHTEGEENEESGRLASAHNSKGFYSLKKGKVKNRPQSLGSRRQLLAGRRGKKSSEKKASCVRERGSRTRR